MDRNKKNLNLCFKNYLLYRNKRFNNLVLDLIHLQLNFITLKEENASNVFKSAIKNCSQRVALF